MGLLLCTSIMQVVISGFCNCCCNGSENTYPGALSESLRGLLQFGFVTSRLLLQPLHVTFTDAVMTDVHCKVLIVQLVACFLLTRSVP